MSGSLRDSLVAWLDDRLEEMLRAPRMWGSREAVELQALLLLGLKTFLRHPAFGTEDPRRVLDAYLAYLRDRYPTMPGSPLHALVADQAEGEFVGVLRDFRAHIDATILDAKPFEHSELAIGLTFAQDDRFVEVVGAGTSPEDFDQEEEVRAIDLDRGVLRLGKKRGVICYVRPDQLASVAEVGVLARVVGKRYRMPSGGHFVLVEELRLRPVSEDQG